MAKQRKQPSDEFKTLRYVVRGGMLNGYYVYDTKNDERVSVANDGMWAAIHERNRLNGTTSDQPMPVGV